MYYEKNENAPVILFVYNRPKHTVATLESLSKNLGANESEVFIFSDNAKDDKEDLARVNEVRGILRKFKKVSNFKKVYIFESPIHKGLAKSVIEGVSSIIENYGRVIVLEDDLVTAIDFLKYMNGALEYYEADENVWSIAGYTPSIRGLSAYDQDVYVCLRAGSWGWATWRDRWDSVDWEVKDYRQFVDNKMMRKLFRKRGYNMPDMLERQMQGKIDSWAIRFCYEQFKQNKVTINPTVSRVRNIGFDGTGTHSGKSDKWDVFLNEEIKSINYLPVQINKKLVKSYYNFYAGNTCYRIYSKIKSFVYNLIFG